MDNNKLVKDLNAIDELLKEIWDNQDYNKEISMYMAEQAMKARSIIKQTLTEIKEEADASAT